MTLTDQDRAVLDFENGRWRYAGAKEEAIRCAFGVTATCYFQWLNRLLKNPEALSYAPHTVNRLNRLRAQRQLVRPRGNLT